MGLFSKIRIILYNKYTKIFPWYCRTFYGMTIGECTIISRRSNLDWNVNPKGIHIGDYTMVAGATILTHDYCRSLKCNTYIGSNCFIGGGQFCSTRCSHWGQCYCRNGFGCNERYP